MSKAEQTVDVVLPKWWQVPTLRWIAFLKRREEQVFLVLTLVIGALVGLIVVAFILLTEHAGLRIYPVGGAPWRQCPKPKWSPLQR
jgi:hypothetical protein